MSEFAIVRPGPRQITPQLSEQACGASLIRAAVVYAKELTPPLILAYRDALFDLSPEAIERAVAEHVNESPWFPKPCEIRERVMARARARREDELQEQRHAERQAQLDAHWRRLEEQCR